MKLRLAFYKSSKGAGLKKKIFHNLIKATTCSKHSHVELIFPKALVGNQSSYSASSIDGSGCVRFKDIQ